MIFNSFLKTSITTLLLCLFSFNASSQEYSNKVYSTFSFTVGMTSSRLLNDTITYRPGILCSGGFMYTIVLSDKLNIGLELLYTGKAFRTESPITKFRYFYVDVPVYLQYKLGDNIRFNMGGQYSTFTNSKIVLLDQTSANGVNVQPYNNIKPADVSFLAGVELDLNENFALATRYTISSSAFFDKTQVSFGVFQLSLNYVVYRSHKPFLKQHKEEK